MQVAKRLAVAGLLAAVFAAPARAEFYNCFVDQPTYDAYSFTLVVKGNITTHLNLTAIQSDPVVNPFAYVDLNILHHATSSSTVTANFTGGNTVITFSDTNPIKHSYSGMFNYGGSSNGKPHFGLDSSSSGGTSVTMTSQKWSDQHNTQSTSSPALSIKGPATSGTHFKYVNFYVNVTAGGQTTGQWFEVPFNTGTSPKITLTNGSTDNLTLSNSGYFISPTLIPLDNLNFNSDPPPGMSGSHYQSLPSLDGQSVGPGGSINNPLPEPSSVISLAMGAVLLAGGYVARRRGGRQ
jgi:hypothetical protein